MKPPQYAVVAYVKNELGRFVEELRRELFPEHGHLPAHLTILPPRELKGSEASTLEALEEACGQTSPFEVALGEVTSFVPATPTVFLQVERGAYRMRELHDKLNTAALGSDEQWIYMPHLTIVKMNDAEQARHALQVSLERWNSYRGPRQAHVEELTFVREGEANRWIDLASLPLGRALARK